MATSFLFARPRLWCRLFGHRFKLAYVERTYSGTLIAARWKQQPSTEVHYRECRCCPTREALMHGPVRTDILNYDWLREKFDAQPAAKFTLGL